MTPEERIAELEKALGEKDATIKTLNTNISKQNSYITSLEQKSSAAKETQLDPMLQSYIQDRMRKERIDEAVQQILTEVSQETFKAVEADFYAFLKDNMKPATTTFEYITDAFALILGRALRKKDHPVHSVASPSEPTPAPNVVPETVPLKDKIVAAIQGQPPSITGNDLSAASGGPDVKKPVQGTKAAFEALNERLKGLGANKFS